MIIMMLKERGSLSYDESLERYIPDLPYKGITIRQLLTHTSGIPDYQAIMDEHWDKNKIADNLDVIDYLKNILNLFYLNQAKNISTATRDIFYWPA